MTERQRQTQTSKQFVFNDKVYYENSFFLISWPNIPSNCLKRELIDDQCGYLSHDFSLLQTSSIQKIKKNLTWMRNVLTMRWCTTSNYEAGFWLENLQTLVKSVASKHALDTVVKLKRNAIWHSCLKIDAIWWSVITKRDVKHYHHLRLISILSRKWRL